MKKLTKNSILILSFLLILVSLAIMGTAWGWDNVYKFFIYNEKAYLIYALIVVFLLSWLFILIKPKRDYK